MELCTKSALWEYRDQRNGQVCFRSPAALAGGRDGRLPVLMLSQCWFDVGAAQHWQIEQNWPVETVPSWGCVEQCSGSALALPHPWTVCGTPKKNEIGKVELVAEVTAFRGPVVLHHLSARVDSGKSWLWVQWAGETSSGIHHPMTREQEGAWVF